MPVRAYSSEKELDAAQSLDLFFVALTLGFDIGCVAVENIDVILLDIDVA